MIVYYTILYCSVRRLSDRPQMCTGGRSRRRKKSGPPFRIPPPPSPLLRV